MTEENINYRDLYPELRAESYISRSEMRPNRPLPHLDNVDDLSSAKLTNGKTRFNNPYLAHPTEIPFLPHRETDAAEGDDEYVFRKIAEQKQENNRLFRSAVKLFYGTCVLGTVGICIFLGFSVYNIYS